MLATLAVLPWLQGFDPAAVTDDGSGYGTLELVTADQRVVASFDDGIQVLDRDDQVIARAPGFTPQGSADEVVALATGDVWIGKPVIALAATSGGHNESTTWLTLYRVERGALAPVWSGEVEHHEGHVTRTGVVLVYPGGLLYRSPDGDTQIWRFDPDRKRFINRTTFGEV